MGRYGDRSRLIVAGVFGLLLILLAFTFPSSNIPSPSSTSPSNSTSSAVDDPEAGRSEDGAQLDDPRSGVSEPEPRETFSPVALAPGEKPPQFVILSFDGSCETRNGVITDLLDLGQEINGRFTLFLSGLCILPDDRKDAYRPPGKTPGRSDIGFGDFDMVDKRLEVMARSYREGHEIGTHFLGHFCGATGVGSWNTKQWRSELKQAKGFLDGWRQYNPQVTADRRLPFDSSVFVGARTPCLEGDRSLMLPAFAAEGLRYDASDPGELKWPIKAKGSDLWEFPLPALHLRDSSRWVLAMDYNFMANQNNANTKADPATCARIQQQTRDTYLDALEATRGGSRAPLIIGSHLNAWVCNAYVNSLHDFSKEAKQKYPDTQFITFENLADWLEAQDPAVLKELQELPAERGY